MKNTKTLAKREQNSRFLPLRQSEFIECGSLEHMEARRGLALIGNEMPTI
jgi:hypothetical protein